jgi:hypothetical protein
MQRPEQDTEPGENFMQKMRLQRSKKEELTVRRITKIVKPAFLKETLNRQRNISYSFNFGTWIKRILSGFSWKTGMQQNFSHSFNQLLSGVQD